MQFFIVIFVSTVLCSTLLSDKAHAQDGIPNNVAEFIEMCADGWVANQLNAGNVGAAVTAGYCYGYADAAVDLLELNCDFVRGDGLDIPMSASISSGTKRDIINDMRDFGLSRSDIGHRNVRVLMYGLVERHPC